MTYHNVSKLGERVTQHVLSDSLVEVANEQSACCLVVEFIQI